MSDLVGCMCEGTAHDANCFVESGGVIESGGLIGGQSSWGFRREGWECPKCGTVWSPDVERCRDCSPDNNFSLI